MEVRAGARRIILDAGSGIRALGERLRDAGGAVAADVLLSHYHYDHLQGLPFFAPLAEPGNRFIFHGPRREGRRTSPASGPRTAPFAWSTSATRR